MRFLILILLFTSCRQEQYKPAEDALDAAREYKNACLKGDFKKAKSYILSNEKNSLNFDELIKKYQQKDGEQKKEFKESSILIISSKEINATTSEIILSNSFDKIPDTISIVKQNNLWLVDLTK
jgi:hypothetical protein